MRSSTGRGPVILILALFSVLSTSISQFSTCSDEFLQLKREKNITFCKKLPTLGAEFAWNYYDNQTETHIDILFGARLPSDTGSWLAWGVNPNQSPQMVGTRALIGIRQPNGTLALGTYNITADTKLGCKLQPSRIDVTVVSKHTEYVSSLDYFAITATLILPPEYNISRLNHVWQVGYDSDEMQPKKHRANLPNVDSTETINLKNQETTCCIGKHRRHLRTVHGILNILGWGTFLPIGVIIARYYRVYPNKFAWWFHFHVSCQIIGYTLGSIGWIIGLGLGRASKHYSFQTHRLLAIFIFTFTTLQMLALRLKPKRKDEYRKFWDMYHHFLGYALLALISVNIFEGIAILKPHQLVWKWAYIGLLGILAIVTLGFETYSWCKFISDKKKKASGQPTSTES
ncbi:cytochrome b561 and DOMON domain-containing protein [Citrus sinensis]|uniref:Cytochrome b561 and DOMON domain-containing protein n=2 Tax=Citrus sinensis TaxID=2711 RepID=A0ACB8P254_CITSI|nr:cytochrome b561 and DOMON domain-containing protein [Citrus sinensis]KDO62082.1 hypothetical protein CISIN_1g015790mg [Citrus sinensis]